MLQKLISALILFSSFTAHSEILNWALEEGSLDWKSAVEICKSKSMRLPTKKELLSVYKTSERKKWKNNWYWTNDELDKERAWIVVLNVGDIVHIPKHYHNHVRCIQ